MQLLSSFQPESQLHSNRFFSMAFRLCKLLVQIQVGKVEIYGEENLHVVDGPMMICANHPHYVDAMILGIVLQHPARYMADEQVFRNGFGIGKFICKNLGAFSAGDGTCSGALESCRTAVNALISNEILVMHPEGHISFASKINHFRNGAIRILNEASNQLGKSAYIIPAYIKYGRYPGSWIRRVSNVTLQAMLMLLGSFYYRRGATVIFGKPISCAELPNRSRIASNFLLAKVAELGNSEVENVYDAADIQSVLPKY
jgi:1-acyl-sn-glycerol-3-phosphate acyltransferase